MSATLRFDRQDLDLRGPVDITIKDLKVEGEWITGVVLVRADFLGQKIDEEFPFKTKNNIEEKYDLPLGAKVFIKVQLKDPHQLCGEARLEWGPIKASTGEQCVQV